VVLPPKLAVLVNDQLERSWPLHRSPGASRYLVPGFNPGRPRNPAGPSEAMPRHGLPGRAARNTALMEALADLPPLVVADLFGMGAKTAERWAAFAGGAWADYIAASQDYVNNQPTASAPRTHGARPSKGSE
jgi:hypothetical protein